MILRLEKFTKKKISGLFRFQNINFYTWRKKNIFVHISIKLRHRGGAKGLRALADMSLKNVIFLGTATMNYPKKNQVSICINRGIVPNNILRENLVFKKSLSSSPFNWFPEIYAKKYIDDNRISLDAISHPHRSHIITHLHKLFSRFNNCFRITVTKSAS